MGSIWSKSHRCYLSNDYHCQYRSVIASDRFVLYKKPSFSTFEGPLEVSGQPAIFGPPDTRRFGLGGFQDKNLRRVGFGLVMKTKTISSPGRAGLEKTSIRSPLVPATFYQKGQK